MGINFSRKFFVKIIIKKLLLTQGVIELGRTEKNFNSALYPRSEIEFV